MRTEKCKRSANSVSKMILFVLSGTAMACSALTNVNYPVQMLFRPLSNPDVSAEDTTNYPYVHDNPLKASEVEYLDTAEKCTTIVHLTYGALHRTKDFSDIGQPMPWPGYFAYYTGARLTNSIDGQSTTTRLYVDHPENFTNATPLFNIPDDVIIYRTDAAGKPDWSYYEYAIVSTVNIPGGYIEVTRARYGTGTKPFDANQAVVATHAQKAMDLYAAQCWLVNMSLHAPVSPDGRTGARWLADYCYTNLYEPLQVDGLEFDLGLFKYDLFGRPLDCDNNLVNDGGYFGGINSFGIGGQEFSKHMRELIGDSAVFQIDGLYPYKGYRGYKYISGLELEDFPQCNDYTSFSQSFQQLAQYNEKVDYTNGFTYPFTKAATTVFGGELDNGNPMDYRFRVGCASACMAGAPHPYAWIDANAALGEGERFGIFDWDEYWGGDMVQASWLGKPLAPMERLTSFGSDLISGTSWSLQKYNNAQGTMSAISGGYAVNVTGVADGGNHHYWDVTMQSAPVTLTVGQEYTLVFDATGPSSWSVNGTVYDRVPSLIGVTFGTGRRHDITVDSSWRTYYLSGIATAGSSPVKFEMAEQVGMKQVRNIKLYAAAGDRFQRKFENGLVVLNASRSDFTTGVDAAYRRIRATPNPTNTAVLMAPEVNNGEFTGSSVTVPAMDAVFLVAMTNYFYIEDRTNGKRFKSVDGAGAFNLTMDTGGMVRWRLTPAGGEYYYIENMTYSNKRLKTVNGGSSFSLANETSDNVKWKLIRATNDYYFIESKAYAGERLRTDDYATQFQVCVNEGPNVRWRFVKP